jgi:hypothetical protein
MHLSRAGRLLQETVVGLLASLGFALAFSYWILRNISGLGLDHDWDYAMEMQWAPFYTVTHFHEFPLWDPYKCGGTPLLGNPQSRILTPWFLFHLLFGPLIGIHLEIIAHLVVGFGGAYLLARLLEIGKLGAIACGAVFAGSSSYYLHLAPGHARFMSGMYAPCIVALFWTGWQRRSLTWAAPTGLMMALIFFEGGIYQTPYVGLVLSVLAVGLAAQYRSIFPLALLAVTGIFTAMFAAPKLLPLFHFMGPYGRYVDPFEANSFSMFIQELFSRDQFFSRDSMGGFWGFWEFGAYIGVIFALLAMIGIALRFWRSIPWSVTALVLLALAAGNHGNYSPWVLLHPLPIFSAQHAPTRMLMLFALCVGILAGFGIDALCSLRRVWLTGLVAIITLIGIIDTWMVSTPNSRYLLGGGDQRTFEPSSIFKQAYLPENNRMFMMAQANLGVVNCYEPASAARNVFGYNVNGYRGEQYLLGNGAVSLARWTPDILDYDIDARSPATLVINQNYDTEWKVNQGRGELFKRNGLLAVEVPAGKQRLELSYHSTSFFHGCLIFLVGLIATVWLYLIQRVWRTADRTSARVGSWTP